MVIGQIVIAKKGRDKGKPFVVIDIQQEYVFLVDGRLRPLVRPKKKKLMHIQPTSTVADLTTDGRALQDADIRKQLEMLNFSQKLG